MISGHYRFQQFTETSVEFVKVALLHGFFDISVKYV